MKYTIETESSWQDDTRQFSSGKALCLGKVKVASVFYNGARSKDDPKAYKVLCEMKGLQSDQGSFLTEEEGKKKAEACLEHWLKTKLSV